MEYITSSEAAEKWGISKRRVNILCSQGRIIGAEKKGNSWLLPKDANKPIDKRAKEVVKKGINFKSVGNGVYYLEKDGMVIGQGMIIPDFANNKLEIFINPEFRGSGYGTELFARLLNLVDDDKLTFEIDARNIKAKRIISTYGGLHIGTTDGVEKYLLSHGKGKKYKRYWLVGECGDLVLVTLCKEDAVRMRSHQKKPEQFTIEEHE